MLKITIVCAKIDKRKGFGKPNPQITHCDGCLSNG